MRLLFWLCLTAASAIMSAPAWSQSAARVALVIGNTNYPDASTPLSTTIGDVRSVADQFRRDGFEVDLKENRTKSEMQSAIDALTAKIRTGMTALFYFSGYGIQVARQTYLIPINAQIWTEADVRRDGISIDTMLAELHRKGAKVKIVIIDAARRNPFERRFRASAEGLSALDASENTLAMYSAAPGKLINDRAGANSLFANELVKELRVPSVRAEEVFNRVRVGVSRASNNEQIPWVVSSLVDEFYFGTPGPSSSSTPSDTTTTTTTTKVGGDIPLSHEREGSLKPKDTFKECAACPEMVVVPAGEFMRGSPDSEAERYDNEGPRNRVNIPRQFAVSKFKVTRDEYDTFVGETNYSGGDRCFTMEDGKAEERSGRSYRNPGFAQNGKHPVVCINWDDARAYVAWLTKKTGRVYRLLSEAEWEFAARAGTTTPFWWGSSISTEQANYDGTSIYSGGAKGEYRKTTMPVDAFQANPWGLYQVHGNSFDWVEDCWNDNYQNAPTDDTVRMAGNCSRHVRRGGSWNSIARLLRAAHRDSRPTNTRAANLGIRVARTLSR